MRIPPKVGLGGELREDHAVLKKKREDHKVLGKKGEDHAALAK